MDMELAMVVMEDMELVMERPMMVLTPEGTDQATEVPPPVQH